MSNFVKSLLFVAVFMKSVLSVYGQANTGIYQLTAKKAQKPLQIDGLLEEPDWQTAQEAKDFHQQFPFDTSLSVAKTAVKFLFDDDFIYIGAICYQARETYVITSLRRDFNSGINDFLTVYFDTFQDQTNGFGFGVTPFGVQREILISDGGNVNADWDQRWFSQVRQYEDRWIVEIAIPLKSVRFKKNTTIWNMNIGRSQPSLNEFSCWAKVPRNFGLAALGFCGALRFEEPLKKPSTNIAIIPYVAGGFSKDFIRGTKVEYDYNFGGDAKIAVSSSLNLDLTFNPDFSQVEVDRQVTNLDRFEIFFPERRQFFLENADLFARFGFSRIRPFFSRRIGIGRDTTTGLIVQNPIIYGARLSGKVNKDWRIGVLNMQTANDKNKGIIGNNYTVAAVQRNVFKRSNLAAIIVNRQATADSTSDFTFNTNDYSRVFGLDYNLFSNDNKWTGKFFYHRLVTPDNRPNAYAHASFIGYNTQRLQFQWNHEYVGNNYTPDVGFVPRTGHWRLEPSVNYLYYPEQKDTNVNFHRFTAYTNFFWLNHTQNDSLNLTEGQLIDRNLSVIHAISFKNTTYIEYGFYRDYTRLFNTFDPSGNDGKELLAGTDYGATGFFMYYESDSRKLFNYNVSADFGQYYNGRRLNTNAEISYRFQPYGSIGVTGSYDKIMLPKDFKSADLYLFGMNLDASVSKSLFLSGFLQYNTQVENVNFNARLQWRFKPVSDLFVVYTENYNSADLRSKNRSFVIKLTYWLNT